MNWKENLAKIIDELEYSHREISAWTGISPTVISNMANKKHDSLKVDQFIKLKLLCKQEHENFILLIFGKQYLSDVKKIEKPQNLTLLGDILRSQYYFEKFSKKELSKATGIASNRIDYFNEQEDETIKIDEITKIEIAMNIPIGTLVKKRFSKIKLQTQKQYEATLKNLKDK